MWDKLKQGRLNIIKNSAFSMANRTKNYIFQSSPGNPNENGIHPDRFDKDSSHEQIEIFYYQLKSSILNEICETEEEKAISTAFIIISRSSKNDEQKNQEENQIKRIEKLESENNKLLEDMKLNETHLLKYSEEMTRKLSDLVTKNNFLDNELKNQKTKLNEAISKNEFLNEDVKKYSNQKKDFRGKIDRKDQTIVTLQMNLELIKKEKISDCNQLKNDLKKKEAEYSENIKQKDKEKNEKKEKIIELDLELKSLKNRVQE